MRGTHVLLILYISICILFRFTYLVSIYLFIHLSVRVYVCIGPAPKTPLFPSRPVSNKGSNNDNYMTVGTPKEEVIEKYVKAKDYGHNNAELYRQKEIVQREVLIEKPADPQRRGLHFVQLQSAELELCPGVYLYFVEDIDLRLKFSTIPNGIVLCTMLKENTHPSNGMHAPPRHVLNKLPELPKGVYAFTIPPLMKTTSGLAYIHDVKHPPSTHIHQRVIAVWIDKDVSLPSGMRFVHISRDFVAPSYNLQSAMYLPLNATQVRECSCMYMHAYIHM